MKNYSTLINSLKNEDLNSSFLTLFYKMILFCKFFIFNFYKRIKEHKKIPSVNMYTSMCVVPANIIGYLLCESHLSWRCTCVHVHGV